MKVEFRFVELMVGAYPMPLAPVENAKLMKPIFNKKGEAWSQNLNAELNKEANDFLNGLKVALIGSAEEDW